MARTHKRPNNDDESDEEKPKERGHKDLKTRSKNSRPQKDEKDKNEDEKSRENRHKDLKTKMKPKNIGDINSYDLEKSIAGVLLTIDKRKGKGSLEEKEVQKHRDAIIATVNKTTDPRKSPDKQKLSQKTGTEKTGTGTEKTGTGTEKTGTGTEKTGTCGTRKRDTNNTGESRR